MLLFRVRSVGGVSYHRLPLVQEVVVVTVERSHKHQCTPLVKKAGSRRFDAPVPTQRARRN
jgi:hypothetical protein